MTEGELKKLIREKGFDVIEGEKNYYGTDPDSVDIWKVEEILDEAKKDFLWAFTLDKISLAEHPLVVEALKKWFGE